MKNSFKVNLSLLLMALLILTTFTGCLTANGPDETSGEAPGETSLEYEGDEAGLDYPMTIIDDAGRTVVIEEEPETIVSIMASNTEILFALGLGHKVIGVTEHCYYPEEAREKEKIGDFTTNIEKVVSLDPDLVLCSRGQVEQAKDLTQFGYTCLLLDPKTLEETMDSIKMVGRATNTCEKSLEITQEMSRELEEIKAFTQDLKEEDRPTVFILIDTEQLYSTGKNTFLNHMIETAGGTNIAGDIESDWPVLSEEMIFEEDPDYIFCTFPIKEEVMARENWQDLKAVKNNQVYNVDNDMVSRPGPRVISGLRQLFDILHPQ